MDVLILIAGAYAIFYGVRWIDRKIFNKNSAADDAIEKIAGGVSLSPKGYLLAAAIYIPYVIIVINSLN